MGNLVEKSFKEIWQSERYWEVQDKIRKHVNVNKDCDFQIVDSIMLIDF